MCCGKTLQRTLCVCEKSPVCCEREFCKDRYLCCEKSRAEYIRTFAALEPVQKAITKVVDITVCRDLGLCIQ